MHTLLLLIAAAAPATATPAQQGWPVDVTKAPGFAPAFAAPAAPSPGARAASASDDFDRPNSTVMGADWSEVNGDIEINSDQGHGLVNLSMMTHTSASAPWETSVQSVKFDSQGGSLFYVASVMGYATINENVFMKVQDNNFDGLYDRVFFYHGNNGGPWNGASYYFDLATPTASGVMTTSFTASGDVAVMEIENHASGVTETFQSSGLLAASAALGQGFGIGTFGDAWFDDYAVNPPTGPSLALLGGCPGLVGVDIGGMTPGQNVAIVAGVAGPFALPAGRPCAGTDIGVDPLAIPQGPIFFVVPADANGEVNIAAVGNAGAGACGAISVVALDLASCAVSNVATL